MRSGTQAVRTCSDPPAADSRVPMTITRPWAIRTSSFRKPTSPMHTWYLRNTSWPLPLSHATGLHVTGTRQARMRPSKRMAVLNHGHGARRGGPAVSRPQPPQQVDRCPGLQSLSRARRHAFRAPGAHPRHEVQAGPAASYAVEVRRPATTPNGRHAAGLAQDQRVDVQAAALGRSRAAATTTSSANNPGRQSLRSADRSRGAARSPLFQPPA